MVYTVVVINLKRKENQFYSAVFLVLF